MSVVRNLRWTLAMSSSVNRLAFFALQINLIDIRPVQIKFARFVVWKIVEDKVFRESLLWVNIFTFRKNLFLGKIEKKCLEKPNGITVTYNNNSFSFIHTIYFADK